MLDTGSVLKDRYLIEKHLGKGGMGSVYLGIDQTFGSKVAIKETIVHGGGLEEAFEREARVLNRLRHGAIPVVMDYFIEGEGRFLVMQYIPGDDLSTVMERSKKPVDPDKVLEWADKLLDALTYLHTQDPPIIHRDIKPQNLKLTDRQEIVLLDFGLSKAAVGSGEKSQSIFGYTPNYAPLEQVQGEGTDARADIYSLAATLYRFLTGIKPPDAVSRATKHPDPMTPICELVPAVSPQVSDVIMKALSIRAENRPATAAEFRAALRGAAFDDLMSLAQGFGDGDVSFSSSPSLSPSATNPSGASAPPASPASVSIARESIMPASELPTIMNPVPDEGFLPTVVTPSGVAPAGFTSTNGEQPTPVAASTPAVAPVADVAPYLPTIVNPLALSPEATPAPPSAAPAPAPAPVELVRNISAPSTVSFVFETYSVSATGKALKKEKRRAKQYFEGAGGASTIQLVEIPAGTFRFGSPDDEPEREPSEGPAAEVSIGPFFLSRSPITQAQYKAVASGLPRVRIDLEPDPSSFKGDERPVECVSWEEAVEFCERLSMHSGRGYRLPSEQEWEYACRAGTETPFFFGPTLTVELANVDGAIAYEKGSEGDGRGETTPVGSVGCANRFGLFDVHGNVWEWTADQWHETLAGAPTDGSVWVEGGDPTVRVVRGGGWSSIPADARSAKRFGFLQKGRQNDVGFRVAVVTGASR